MEKVYKSKVSKWYLSICIGTAIVFIGSLFLCLHSALVLLIDVVLLGFGLCLMFDMLLHTDYRIKGDKLYIRCGILFHMTLPVSKITLITHKSTILSSPALSAKRIGLKYGRSNWVYISPVDQDEFIADLKTINPEITEV